MTDPIADLLNRVKNGIKAHHQIVLVPHSKIKENIVKIMKQNHFVESYEVKDQDDHKNIEIALKEGTYDLNFRRVSKPGQRIYVKNPNLKQIKSGLGIAIVSTSKGIMTNYQAKKQNLGGELLCEIY